MWLWIYMDSGIVRQHSDWVQVQEGGGNTARGMISCVVLCNGGNALLAFATLAFLQLASTVTRHASGYPRCYDTTSC